jgi:hypothetical protein
MRVKIENGAVSQYPYTLKDLKSDNPNTSFPSPISDEMLESLGVYDVWVNDRPDYDWKTQAVDQDTQPSYNSEVDKWVLNYTVRSLTAEELTDLASVMANKNRGTRDKLIAETDWWASSDLTMTSAQTAYRQALRDITSHANWPHLDEADWPTKP